MALRELYNPESGRMRVAGLISGSGSNLVKIIEHERKIEATEGRSPYMVSVIFSDNSKSNAVEIGKKYDLPVIVRDIRAFYKSRGVPRRDMNVRAEFDKETVKILAPFGIDVAAYAGYMSVATDFLINAFLGVNVHPADLSVMEGKERKYTGDHAVRDAILAGEKQIRSTTHIISNRVDYGGILMISPPVDVTLPQNFDPRNKDQVKFEEDDHQNRLKEAGDWVIFPKTLEYLSCGRYSQDEKGNLFFNEKGDISTEDRSIPFGVRL